jgi:hypothetical protein
MQGALPFKLDAHVRAVVAQLRVLAADANPRELEEGENAVKEFVKLDTRVCDWQRAKPDKWGELMAAIRMAAKGALKKWEDFCKTSWEIAVRKMLLAPESVGVSGFPETLPDALGIARSVAMDIEWDAYRRTAKEWMAKTLKEIESKSRVGKKRKHEHFDSLAYWYSESSEGLNTLRRLAHKTLPLQVTGVCVLTSVC